MYKKALKISLMCLAGGALVSTGIASSVLLTACAGESSANTNTPSENPTPDKESQNPTSDKQPDNSSTTNPDPEVLVPTDVAGRQFVAFDPKIVSDDGVTNYILNPNQNQNVIDAYIASLKKLTKADLQK